MKNISVDWVLLIGYGLLELNKQASSLSPLLSQALHQTRSENQRVKDRTPTNTSFVRQRQQTKMADSQSHLSNQDVSKLVWFCNFIVIIGPQMGNAINKVTLYINSHHKRINKVKS